MFGAGYVGLVTGACFADLGHEVVVRDVLPERIEQLEAGEVPIYEPGLDLVLERNRERLRFTVDVHEAVDGADFLFVAVGTPPTYSGDADLSAVWSVVDELPDDLSGNPIVVMKSTVPVGTGEHVRARLDARGLSRLGYVSNPEFLSEGSAVADFMSPDRVVVGSFASDDCERVVELYRGVETEIVRTDVASAELVKLAANAFLSTRISFINEIANVCELVGADVIDVSRGMGLDKRIGSSYLYPGVGFGGSCFPKDISFLKLLAGHLDVGCPEDAVDDHSPKGLDLEVLVRVPQRGGDRSAAAARTQPIFSFVASAVPFGPTSAPIAPERRSKLMLTMSASRPAIDSTRLPPPPMRIGGCGFCTGLGVPSCAVTV